MFKSCTQKYTDESTETTFHFSFYCDLCGEQFRSTIAKFTADITLPETTYEKKLWQMLWRREHWRAFERANFQAHYHFYTCPDCARLVCDQCTIVKLEPDGGIRRERCVQCQHKREIRDFGPSCEIRTLD